MAPERRRVWPFDMIPVEPATEQERSPLSESVESGMNAAVKMGALLSEVAQLFYANSIGERHISLIDLPEEDKERWYAAARMFLEEGQGR